MGGGERLNVAVVGSGVAGLSAAWLLSQKHNVTLFEADHRLGGHAHTAEAAGHNGPLPVDTGFIVYNETNYPNFTALLVHLGVPSLNADMSLSVSLDDGAFEYSSFGLGGVFAQKRNLLSPRFWKLLLDIERFFRTAPRDLEMLEANATPLDAYLAAKGYGEAFRDDHLLPQAAAIWSTPLDQIGAYPAASLIRFFQNHGMMSIVGRGLWRTVDGGSRAYVSKLVAAFQGEARKGARVAGVRRDANGVELRLASGSRERFDQVVMATHGDTALGLLDDPSAEETRLLGAFKYSRNMIALHTDTVLMPKRRRAWTSWNHIGRRDAPGEGAVTYWMNRLQSLNDAPDLFVTLNPNKEIAADKLIKTEVYDHPLFDAGAIAAQQEIWDIQGARRTWFCGSYLGHGFHEDALQSGLAVAEQLGGVRRPWTVAGESGRIHVREPALAEEAA
ncbi:MAG: FAD-dependent oxidoreductase [Alphaproteobacteria bacterium]|nr:FAD-dependent oxidoreductase [Alphaproteobacteria bacterium]MBU1515115.1 FAD-dependent oxidoreductase [Alphaproteobacteria bacterium]MBU2093473.1 FAD-dependent oxidoreductase [Alphaproteobacteria bacterium]MBU2152321.1 FAD-dependent oxidoreductase [Alphaproteobacteria bacterium]MBU2308135.1 FAD-dependent oxidoreductase [Alphaproteobacteria bacterium]